MLFCYNTLMIITHHKGEFIKVSVGDTTLAFNPISKKSKLPVTRFGADVALISLNHPDTNGTDEVTRSAKPLFIIDGPGEYEVGGVFIKGVPSKSQHDGHERINTMYAVQMEDINMLFLGALGDEKPNLSIVEDMESVDILFVPIGNEGVLPPDKAHALAVSLEAKVIIPIHYDGIGIKGALKTFLSEAGEEKIQPVEKLTIKKKDVTEKTGEIVVLAS